MFRQRTIHTGHLIASLVIIVLLSLAYLQAESTLNFPRLSFEPDTLTGVAIVNPSNGDAQVTITAYGADGQPLAGIQNPVVTIAANQQFSKLTSELFGEGLDPATVGWFQATSPVDDLTGFFLFLNTSFTLFDGADLPSAAGKIVFSQVRLDSGYSTELNIINPSSAAADLQLELIGADSSPVIKALSLPAMGAARLDVATFFQITVAPFNAYVTVTSDVDIAGFEFVRAPDGDLVGLNARSATEQLTHLYFPQMAVLGPFQTRAGVVNNSTQAVILTITAFKPDGSLYGTENLQNNPVTRSLGPGGILVEDVASMFGFSGEQLLDGWIRVESTSAAVTGFLTYGVPETGSAATVISNRVGQSRAIFSHIATVEGFFTGVAVLNTGQLAANVRVLVIQPSGQVLGSFGTVLQPGQRLSKLINELIPEAAGQSGGLIWVSSDLPVYLTSLFGSSNVLANIPPQAAPQTYNPDAGLAAIALKPLLAIVQPNSSQTFQVQGNGGSAIWKVNDIKDGNTTIGTISSAGLYTAPSQVPSPRVVTVSAEVDAQTAGASVDVLEKTQLLTSQLIVQSVAYLGSLQKLYTAELLVLGGAGNSSGPLSHSVQQQVTESQIFEVPAPGVAKVSLITFSAEEISKMIPFRAGTGTEFLLLAARTSGRVIRFNPATQESKDVVTGLNKPGSLVIDPSSGNLLVAEQDKVTIISRTQLESDLLSTARTSHGGPKLQAVTLFSTRADGVALDRCTGDVYVSDSQLGVIRQYVALTQELKVRFSGLQQPGQLLALYRNGVSCPDSFQLLVVERGADRLTLLTPSQELVTPWVGAFQSTDLAFLPEGTPFAATAAILLTELVGGGQPQQNGSGSSVTLVGVPDLYNEQPDNELPPEELPSLPAVFADQSLEACVRAALGIGDGILITQELARTLTQLDCSFQSLQQLDPTLETIRLLDGMEVFVNLTQFGARGNVIENGTPLGSLTNLVILDLAENRINSVGLEFLSELPQLTDLDLSGQTKPTPFGGVPTLAELDNLSGMVNLVRLKLADNAIIDISPLSGLTGLNQLELQMNRIADIAPLVVNAGLGAGDSLNLLQNNLGLDDCPDLQSLINRGVAVQHNVACP
ncbi:hypothetical protein MYX75_01785 [Acidobacteria bacterium AH-259-A15]|nr:hypothetical protein [Acidobacteria bacterium AH-259-A15]